MARGQHLGEELKAAHPDRFVTFRAEDALAQPEILADGIIAHRPRLADVFVIALRHRASSTNIA